MRPREIKGSLSIWRRVSVLGLLLALLPHLIFQPYLLLGQSNVMEVRGELPDGTVYMMQRPANWNKVVIRDLDYAANFSTPRYTTLLDRGFAIAGTMRHRLRMYQYDPAREIANLCVADYPHRGEG